MARVMPHIAVLGMDFLIVELDAAAPIKHIAEAGCLTLDPDALNLFAPAGLKNFINV
jgi:hypothetical protein